MLITYGSLASFEPSEDGWPGMDKVVHFIFYLVLTLLVLLSLSREWDLNFSFRTTFIVAIAIAFGIIIELIQRYIPGRSFEWADILINILGTLTGYQLYKKWF